MSGLDLWLCALWLCVGNVGSWLLWSVCLCFLVVGEFGLSVKLLLSEFVVGWIVDSGDGIGLFASQAWLRLRFGGLVGLMDCDVGLILGVRFAGVVQL